MPCATDKLKKADVTSTPWPLLERWNLAPFCEHAPLHETAQLVLVHINYSLNNP